MYLVVDCETNRLPRDWQASIRDLDNWPRVVQLAWVLYDVEHRVVDYRSRLVQPDGWRMSSGAAQVHGISYQRAKNEGFPIRDVMYELWVASQKAHYFIAHNASFDGSVLAAEFLRQDWDPPFVPSKMICTMERSTDYCALSGPYGHRWPKLDELHTILFGAPFEGAHDAGADAAACGNCFFELKNRGVIRL